MNYSLLLRHQTLISIFGGFLCLAISLSFGLGQLKTWAEIAWLDVLGEGSVALLSFVWIFFLLVSRPPGKVTSALVLGLCFFMFSALLDFFDKFEHYNNAAAFLSLIESIPAGIGMFIMTYALYQWHQEQLTLNRQLQRREAHQREHQQVDFITSLYRADYMRDQIDLQLRTKQDSAFSVVIMDIDNFDQFNRTYGHHDGDRVLREVAELILINLRKTDLLCRYAGDRFILLLPDTGLDKARELADEICQAVRHWSFKTSDNGDAVFHKLTFAADESRNNDDVEPLINRVNRQLDLVKQA
ncbi:GGDEF domain-containing protein [Neptunicella marina]|uniref:diguanylate cyclase n=1 Tax=Neptunicella marina TaxID=2125989 RepID=A0A8J6M469_9ALTE|nr:diguanylate cyclase [Neptunicella marina]MBC3765876.1 diguanylate cyclase [Neptunicella marina]